MDNREIRPCAICGKGIANDGQGNRGPMVGAKVTVQRLIIDAQRMNEHLGLEQHFALAGSQNARTLADILGPGSVIDEPKELRNHFFVCEECLLMARDMPTIFECLERAEKARLQLEPADGR